jgi:hypothetical protein
MQTLSTSLLAQQVLTVLVGTAPVGGTTAVPLALNGIVPSLHGVARRTSGIPDVFGSSGPTARERYTFSNTGYMEELFAIDRDTTWQEHIIGELRRWRLFPSNWDGEGADAPSQNSVAEAIRFSRLLSEDVAAEPMMFASGRAGLYWRNPSLYADLEFLGDGRIAYYIEQNGDKHKGVVKFDAREMPDLFEALLPT